MAECFLPGAVRNFLPVFCPLLQGSPFFLTEGPGSDKAVSICLGRPVAVDGKDCYCELPLGISDDDLEPYCQTIP